MNNRRNNVRFQSAVSVLKCVFSTAEILPWIFYCYIIFHSVRSAGCFPKPRGIYKALWWQSQYWTVSYLAVGRSHKMKEKNKKSSNKTNFSSVLFHRTLKSMWNNPFHFCILTCVQVKPDIQRQMQAQEVIGWSKVGVTEEAENQRIRKDVICWYNMKINQNNVQWIIHENTRIVAGFNFSSVCVPCDVY